MNFILEIEGIGTKYSNTKDKEHLIDALRAQYEGNQDWTGGLFCEITLK